MEWWWVKLDFNENLDKMHVKLFPNFTSFSFDNLGIILEYHGWQIYDHNRRFFTCLLSCRELHVLKRLENTRFQAPTGMKGIPQNVLLNFQLEYKHQLIQPYHLSSIRNFRNFLSNGKHPPSLKGLWREAPNRRLDQSEREFLAYSQW